MKMLKKIPGKPTHFLWGNLHEVCLRVDFVHLVSVPRPRSRVMVNVGRPLGRMHVESA